MNKWRNKLGLLGEMEFSRALLPSARGTHRLSCLPTFWGFTLPDQKHRLSDQPEGMRTVRATQREAPILLFLHRFVAEPKVKTVIRKPVGGPQVTELLPPSQSQPENGQAYQAQKHRILGGGR